MKRKYWTIVERVSRDCRSLTRRRVSVAFLSFVLLAMVASCVRLSDAPSVANEEPSTSATEKTMFVDVDLCEVLNRPFDFDGREIRVSAILIAGFESAFAYDPRCVSENQLVWFEIKSDSVSRQIEPYFAPETEEFRTLGLNRMRGRFVGLFETKKEVGFGHLNSANHKLTITKAVDLRSVEPSEPYPWKRAQKRD